MTTGARKPGLAGRIRRGECLFGLIVKMPAASVVEVAGLLGYDLVVIDLEHGLGETALLEEHLRAADSVGIDVVVRVGTNDPLQILRVLDAGTRGVIVPHVDSPEQAEAAVAAAHYPPRGKRGLAMTTRAGRYSTRSLSEHLDEARSETVVIVQAEDKLALGHLKEIVTTDGVDAVWLGTSDLSMSLGRPGEISHPVVVEAIDQIVSAVQASGSTALCVVAESADNVLAWQERGATIVLFIATTLQTAHLQGTIDRARGTSIPAQKD